jgi:protein-tyrosine phosphatase
VGYVDIHSHVLYGLDDGAKTREQSLQMLQRAAESGTTEIVATPHANGQYAFQPKVIEARIAELSADLGAETGLRIYPGCDFHLQFDNIEDAVAHPQKYTINHHCYLLVEFPDVGVFSGTDAILDRLLGGGMVPIVTHPERNRELQGRLDDLARWVEMGCYIQITAGSCIGTFGKSAKRCAHELMHRGLTHFVASDAHDLTFRTPSLREAYAVLADRWGEDLIRPLFVDNPRAVLAGDTVDFELPASGVKRRKWYQFWTG